MNLFDLVLPFILGFLFTLIINYLIYNYFEKHETNVFTKGISTEIITFTRDYQELLKCRIVDDSSYFIIYKNTYYNILNSYWSLFDIKDWLDLLDEEQDYAVTFELITKTSEGLILNNPTIILSNEFMVNNKSNPVIISSLLSTQLENTYNLFNSEYNENHYIVIRYTVLMASH